MATQGWLSGGAGNDVYRFGSGANVVVYDADVNGNDLVLADAALIGNDMVLYYWNFNDDRSYSLTLQGWGLGGGYSITQYQQNYSLDSSGYSENIRYILGGGTNSSDSINYASNTSVMMFFGFDGNDTYRGGEARDMVYDGNGDDRIKGQVGNDWLYGEAGNDILFGGVGNDGFVGGSGSDTYWFGNSDPTVNQDDLGHDTIAGAADNFQDVLQLCNLDILQGATKSGNDLRHDLFNVEQGGVTNSITLQRWFDGQECQIQTLSNQQGNTTSMYMLQAGSDGDDYADYGNSNSVLYFGLGGNDAVFGSGSGDVLFGGGSGGVVYGGDGNDLLIVGGASSAAYMSFIASMPG